MKHFINFVECFGGEVSPMSHSNTDCTSHASVTEFQSAIADVILEDKMNQIERSGVYSIVTDESTDKANHKC